MSGAYHGPKVRERFRAGRGGVQDRPQQAHSSISRLQGLAEAGFHATTVQREPVSGWQDAFTPVISRTSNPCSQTIYDH